jgi:Family of unknown function (DUF6308)
VTEWFLDDDAGYLAWLAAHENGFVLNTYAHVAAGYLVLHEARCRTINRDLAPDKAWTGQYGKACADTIHELVEWAAQRTSGTPHGCGTCQPDVPTSPYSSRGATHRPRGSRAVQQTHLDLKLVGDPTTVTIRRVDGGPTLVIDGAQWVAETFFRLDRSAVGPKSYDARVQSCPKDRFELADLRAVNGSMATRMPDKWWIELLDGVPRPWLAALDPAWTLLDLSDAAWEEGHVTDRLRAALKEMVGDHRGRSVATKLLHLKRPALVPILDSLVVDQLGGRGLEGSALIEHVRAEGRRNLDALQSIQRELATIVGPDGQPIRRSLVRILDVLLWATHPASALFPVLGSWRSEFRRTGHAP